MPEYLSPGVYVEEIDAGPKPIEGVSTSTAGAVGVTAMGPTSGKPELVTSFSEFMRKFGGFLIEPDNATVNQFGIEPDGGRSLVAISSFGQRLLRQRWPADLRETGVLRFGCGLHGHVERGRRLIAEIEQDAAATATSVKVRHLFNIDVGAVVQLVRGDNGNSFANGPFTVSSYNPTTRVIGLTPTAGAGLGLAASVARGDHVRIHTIQSGAANATLNFTAKARGIWGDDLSVSVRPVLAATFNVLADPAIAGAVSSTTLTTPQRASATTSMLRAMPASWSARPPTGS